MLVDSHCHLDFPEFAEDFDGVLTRARDAGIGHFLSIGTQLHRFDPILKIAEAHDDISCTVGVHPHSADDEKEVDVSTARLVEIARHPKVVGIGETGLDFFYDNAPRDRQKESFRRHIRAAIEADVPLIVHTRDADEDTIAILREEGEGTRLKGLLHCFSSSRKLAEEAVAFGFHISFSGILTFKKAEELRETAKALPVERLLVETDAPFLAPMPHRGKRNEPSFVVHTAARLAELHGLTLEELANQTSRNFFRLFDRIPRPQALAA